MGPKIFHLNIPLVNSGAAIGGANDQRTKSSQGKLFTVSLVDRYFCLESSERKNWASILGRGNGSRNRTCARQHIPKKVSEGDSKNSCGGEKRYNRPEPPCEPDESWPTCAWLRRASMPPGRASPPRWFRSLDWTGWRSRDLFPPGDPWPGHSTKVLPILLPWQSSYGGQEKLRISSQINQAQTRTERGTKKEHDRNI